MSRQLGFALGVAILVAVFTGAAPDTGGGPPAEGTRGEPPPAAVAEEFRDAFGDSFRVAALCVLCAVPFALAMRRKPADAHAAHASVG
jgi:hypothetical protein